MSTATLFPFPNDRHVHDLELQRRALGGQSPELLVVCCTDPEPSAGSVPAWERQLGPTLFVRSPGASVQDAEVREALRHAVQELGVKEILVVLHSRSSHLLPERSPEEVARERGLPFMERVYAGQARSRDQLAAAKERVRETVRSLHADPALTPAHASGAVHLVESGVLLAYDPQRGDFEALL